MKLGTVQNAPGMLTMYCPGCKNHHAIYVEGWKHKGPIWEFNNDFESSTFSPSLLLRTPYGPEQKLKICHSFIKNGNWEFLSDCTHDLAGQIVPMEDI